MESLKDLLAKAGVKLSLPAIRFGGLNEQDTCDTNVWDKPGGGYGCEGSNACDDNACSNKACISCHGQNQEGCTTNLCASSSCLRHACVWYTCTCKTEGGGDRGHDYGVCGGDICQHETY